ncbi:phosphatase 2C-like domain-containing protein [Flagelloscypha sp. PMI_526]|nr:phosphatase 2C-like domain-containing protein [Flagelloscypha sp. PMI_526]
MVRLHHHGRLRPLYNGVRFYHDYLRFAMPGGTGRLPLNNPKLIGIVNSRGSRSHQEDFYAFAALSLHPEELQLNVKKAHGLDWNPSDVGEPLARQVVMVGIYDGHGGSAVAQYLPVNKEMELGGYFRRFRGGLIAPWTEEAVHNPPFDLGARATAAFFEGNSSGATASDGAPFFASKQVSLTVAHCGDTRVLLASTDGGHVLTMTEEHHADARVESARLRRMMGTSLVMDSFGESRLGDLNYKKFGVTAEPDIRHKLLEGTDWACMVLISDGISSMMSDQEVVDLTRRAHTPKHAAERILEYAEALGGEDNATAVVVPLSGWGKTKGPDQTEELRDYRRNQAVGTERQRLIM